MIAWLAEWDKALLFRINPGMGHPAADWLFPVLREKFTWIPVYLLLIYWLYLRHRSDFWQILGLIAVLVVCTDQLSSSILKPWVSRLRPCHQPGVMEHLRHVLDHCGGQFGFVSSHAANHFGLSTFLFLLTGKRLGAGLALFSWAFLVAFAQVYVGVHYPGDVIFGGLLGGILGWGIYQVYIRKFSTIQTRS